MHCNHPAAQLAVVREQVVTPLDADFEKVTYHLACMKCGEPVFIEHARTVRGAAEFLKAKPMASTPCHPL